MRDIREVLADLDADASMEAARSFADLAAAYVAAARGGEGPVSTPCTPPQLAARFAEPMPEGGRPLAEVLARVEHDVIAGANRLCHPMAMGHQVSAPLPAAVWTDVVISALNQSMAVWEMSPTATVLERQVVRWMTDAAGFGPAAGGTLTSGGTEATFTALLAARAVALPDAWEHGVGANPPVVLCGAHAHYAVTRAVAELGLGLRAALVVPSEGHRMSPRALREMLDALAVEGRPVMAVVATAGCTPTGAFDDLEAIGGLCEERGIWLHVDGAHGASALLSPTQAHRMRGVARARSLAWDPHKMLLLPLSAGMLLVRDAAELESAFAQRAPYLFHGAGDGPRWDVGPRSFQCSRRADALKLWVALQRYGADGLGLLYDHLCATTRRLHDAVRARSDFEALHEPDANILCFRWRPAGARDDAALDALNGELRARFNRGGAGWITTTVLDGRRVLRATVMNPLTRGEHVERLLDALTAEGEALLAGVGE